MEWTHLTLLLLVGSIAGFLNVIAGGGSTLTLPALIFLGLDSTMANGTNRVAILMQNVFAVYGFQQEKLNEFRISLKFAAFTLPGAVAGALMAVRISDDLFQKILGIIMILVVISMFLPRPVNHVSDYTKNSKMLYPVLFAIGFYGGFIQVGVGFIIMGALFHLAYLSLIKVNVHKVFMVLLYTIPVLIIFIISEKVVWIPALVLAAGNSIGGWIAARISVKKGEGFIRIILAIALIIIAFKLMS